MIKEGHKALGKLFFFEKKIIFFSTIAILFLLLLIFILKFYVELLPFIFGAALAYLLAPIAVFFENLVKNKTLAVFISLFIGLSIILLFLAIIMPILLQQLHIVYKNLVAINLTTINAAFHKFSLFDSLPEYLVNVLQNSATEIPQRIAIMMSIFFEHFISYTGHIAVEIVLIFTIAPFTAFYLLRDRLYFKEKIIEFIPLQYRVKILNIVLIIDSVFVNFILGQLWISCILTAYFIVCFFIFEFHAYIGIGLIMGLLSLIPYAGSFVIIILSFLLVISKFSFFASLFIIAVIGGLPQLLDIMVLRPKLMGNRLGLYPVLTVLSIIVSASLLGFIGMFFAIPLTVLLMMIIRLLFTKYKAVFITQNGEKL